MPEPSQPQPKDDPSEFYAHTIDTLGAAGVSFLIGGAYSLRRYAKIERDTKDLDLFVRPADVQRALDVLGAAGYRAELTFPHWLGKAHDGDRFVDLIFRSGNGVFEVDDVWFDHAPIETILGREVRLCPAEEVLCTKLLIMERERYDGADVAHMLLQMVEQLDWRRVLTQLGRQWPVLLSHLLLFGYIYPSERERIPPWLLDDLLGRFDRERAAPPPAGRLCRGTILSRGQYLEDIQAWGFRDARVEPIGNMTSDETAAWTEAIDSEE